MNLLVWLILVASVNSTGGADARRSRQASRSSRNNRRELSDDDILKALTILLQEADQEIREEKVSSSGKGRQKKVSQREDRQENESKRQGRQGFEGVLGNCETTGFEVRVREECEEVFETKCERVNTTNFRSEIVNKCKTLVDQNCNVTYTEVPTKKCVPRQRNKCETEYKIVEDKIYKEECKVDVQHVCEEHIKVPVEVPYPVPSHDIHRSPPYHSVLDLGHPPDPHLTPAPHVDQYLPPPHHSLLDLGHLPDPHLTPAPHVEQYLPLPHDSYLSLLPDHHEPPQHDSFHAPVVHATPLPHELHHPTQVPKYFHTEMDGAESHHHASPPKYSYDPTPAPKYLESPTPNIYNTAKYQTTLQHHSKPELNPLQISQLTALQSSPLVLSLFNQLNPKRSRKKRSFVFPGSAEGPPGMIRHHDIKQEERDNQEKMLKKIVKQVLKDVIEKNQELGEVKATIKKSRSIDPINYQFHLPSPDPYHDPLHHEPLLHGPLHPDTLHHYPLPHDLLHHDPIHQDTLQQDPLHHDHLHHHPIVPHEPEYPPIITTHELPAPPGCRSLATKECHKIPVIIPKKVPYEVCNIVPDIDCVNVLKTVPELACTPEVYRECNDFEKKIPYLVEEDECFEAAFDECVEIEERVPVELCKRKRLDEESITLSRGQVVRKEGEKRRTPAFRKGTKGNTRTRNGSSSSSSSSSRASSSSSSSTSSSGEFVKERVRG